MRIHIDSIIACRKVGTVRQEKGSCRGSGCYGGGDGGGGGSGGGGGHGCRCRWAIVAIKVVTKHWTAGTICRIIQGRAAGDTRASNLLTILIANT